MHKAELNHHPVFNHIVDSVSKVVESWSKNFESVFRFGGFLLENCHNRYMYRDEGHREGLQPSFIVLYHLLFSHHPGKGWIFKKHILIFFLPHNGFPISIFGVFFKNFVARKEKFVEAFIIVSNVPSQDTTRLDNSQKFLESLGNNGTWEHSSGTQHGVVGVVFNWGLGIGSNVAAENFTKKKNQKIILENKRYSISFM